MEGKHIIVFRFRGESNKRPIAYNVQGKDPMDALAHVDKEFTDSISNDDLEILFITPDCIYTLYEVMFDFKTDDNTAKIEFFKVFATDPENAFNRVYESFPETLKELVRFGNVKDSNYNRVIYSKTVHPFI